MMLRARWIDSGREPQCPPDPRYPKGVDLDVSNGKWGCHMPLPYPAKRCGYFVVECDICGANVAITTAGRPDDPRSIRLPCKRKTKLDG